MRLVFAAKAIRNSLLFDSRQFDFLIFLTLHSEPSDATEMDDFRQRPTFM